MIIYRNSKGGFKHDVRDNIIAEKIENAFFEHCISHNNDAEYRSWANSMQYMCNVLDDNDIPDECRVAIEYQIPLTSKRIDFLISGQDEHSKDSIVIIELKQWESSEPTSRPDIVTAFTGGANRAVAHPSYQAYSYAKIIEGYNQTITDRNIQLIPCAYLHNYKEEFRRNIDQTYYSSAVALAPVFLNRDGAKLRDFIKQFIKKAGREDVLMTIENGQLKPSKSLQDTLASMLHGNREFYLIDEQKVAYETVRKLVENVLAQQEKHQRVEKHTVIIHGGPGTGKSVIAIQLLCDLITKGYSALYVTKNAAPRNVYFEKLRQEKFSLNYVKSLFKGSGTFVDAKANEVDCILADEAHRLQMKSGMFQNLGESQVKEIINAAKISVFLIDEEQKVTTSDCCTVEMIRQYAKQLGSTVIEGKEYDLMSQFRCNGSDGYLVWLDNLLGLKPSPNVALGMDYDIRVFDNPCEMREELRRKNMINNKSRMLAGYCYDWKSKNDLSQFDIILPHGFYAQWNFGSTSTWAIDADSFNQVGCIHTSQGLEFDHVGVIIGRDLYYKDGEVQTDFTKRAHTDKSLNGIRTNRNYSEANAIIRNTYRTLMSRGMKGCYIYCEDEALATHIREMLELRQIQTLTTIPQMDDRLLDDAPELDKYISYFPVYSIKAACGVFGRREPVSPLGWMKVEGTFAKDRTKFIVQAKGRSMEPKIQDGDYCLFKMYSGGSRDGKIVLAEHPGEVDSEQEGAYSIKQYHSTKVVTEEGWQHESIELRPLNSLYDPIVITEDNAEDFRIVGEFIQVL